MLAQTNSTRSDCSLSSLIRDYLFSTFNISYCHSRLISPSYEKRRYFKDVKMYSGASGLSDMETTNQYDSIINGIHYFEKIVILEN